MRPTRRLIPLALLATLACLPSLAHAYVYGPYGVEIRWDQCFGDAGVPNKNFACNTNSGGETLVASFVPAWDIVNVSGMEIVVDVATSSSTLPAWWQFKNTGTCRQGSMSMNTAGTIGGACPDWGLGLETGGIGAYSIGEHGPNFARWKIAIAVNAANLQNLTGRAEYFAFNIVINNLKTVGTGACAGCTVPACIVFQGLNMTTPTGPPNDRYLTGPSNLSDSDFATWQGGGMGSDGGGCPAAVPTVKRSWGAVKALYH